MRSYYFVLTAIILLYGCQPNSSQAEKDYIKNLEEKNRALEKELQDAKRKPGSNNVSEKSTNDSSEYFTIGSTEKQVLKVMGDPDTYLDYGTIGGKMFRYGGSVVNFEKGRVVSYNNSGGNLRVKVRH